MDVTHRLLAETTSPFRIAGAKAQSQLRQPTGKFASATFLPAHVPRPSLLVSTTSGSWAGTSSGIETTDMPIIITGSDVP